MVILKVLLAFIELFFICLGVGVLIGISIGIYIVAITVQAYKKAAEIIERIRLGNFKDRN